MDASYRFGDRVLYLHSPLLRGEDVAELQFRLGSIGFDPGVVDGVFGTRTLAALKEFQTNVALPDDGICGPGTIDELRRLFGRSPQHVHGVREREGLRNSLQRQDSLIVAVTATDELEGPAELIAQRLRRRGMRTLTIHSPDQSELAAAANAGKADLCIYLSFALTGIQLSYYSGFSYSSPVGTDLAQALAEGLAKLEQGGRLILKGMTLPILRETRMPTAAIQISPASLWVQSAPEIADAIVAALGAFTTSG